MRFRAKTKHLVDDLQGWEEGGEEGEPYSGEGTDPVLTDVTDPWDHQGGHGERGQVRSLGRDLGPRFRGPGNEPLSLNDLAHNSQYEQAQQQIRRPIPGRLERDSISSGEYAYRHHQRAEEDEEEEDEGEYEEEDYDQEEEEAEEEIPNLRNSYGTSHLGDTFEYSKTTAGQSMGSRFLPNLRGSHDELPGSGYQNFNFPQEGMGDTAEFRGSMMSHDEQMAAQYAYNYHRGGEGESEDVESEDDSEQEFNEGDLLCDENGQYYQVIDGEFHQVDVQYVDEDEIEDGEYEYVEGEGRPEEEEEEVEEEVHYEDEDSDELSHTDAEQSTSGGFRTSLLQHVRNAADLEEVPSPKLGSDTISTPEVRRNREEYDEGIELDTEGHETDEVASSSIQSPDLKTTSSDVDLTLSQSRASRLALSRGDKRETVEMMLENDSDRQTYSARSLCSNTSFEPRAAQAIYHTQESLSSPIVNSSERSDEKKAKSPELQSQDLAMDGSVSASSDPERVKGAGVSERNEEDIHHEEGHEPLKDSSLKASELVVSLSGQTKEVEPVKNDSETKIPERKMAFKDINPNLQNQNSRKLRTRHPLAKAIEFDRSNQSEEPDSLGSSLNEMSLLKSEAAPDLVVQSTKTTHDDDETKGQKFLSTEIRVEASNSDTQEANPTTTKMSKIAEILTSESDNDSLEDSGNSLQRRSMNLQKYTDFEGHALQPITESRNDGDQSSFMDRTHTEDTVQDISAHDLSKEVDETPVKVETIDSRIDKSLGSKITIQSQVGIFTIEEEKKEETLDSKDDTTIESPEKRDRVTELSSLVNKENVVPTSEQDRSLLKSWQKQFEGNHTPTRILTVESSVSSVTYSPDLGKSHSPHVLNNDGHRGHDLRTSDISLGTSVGGGGVGRDSLHMMSYLESRDRTAMHTTESSPMVSYFDSTPNMDKIKTKVGGFDTQKGLQDETFNPDQSKLSAAEMGLNQRLYGDYRPYFQSLARKTYEGNLPSHMRPSMSPHMLFKQRMQSRLNQRFQDVSESFSNAVSTGVYRSKNDSVYSLNNSQRFGASGLSASSMTSSSSRYQPGMFGGGSTSSRPTGLGGSFLSSKFPNMTLRNSQTNHFNPNLNNYVGSVISDK
eukprot:CAMPEP_0115037928 /NCGR_PEP_ID=MMETSP0216-20121206/43097_1 /TAXON_ID=223996 /ORGANISM="Protocruzia adherens, Strain Boccale" /LENGTH=1119 /DNA_ID=CAMNT_0002418215 /DNA_START=148 /DNA_END=3507 /DNA_ORIENTATION=+